MSKRPRPPTKATTKRTADRRPAARKGPGVRAAAVEPERLQKLLARSGMGSRRTIEALIEAGEVMVDGRLARLGDKATPDARITVRGRPVSGRRLEAPPVRVIGLNKPAGVISTRYDPEGRETIVKLLPRLPKGRWAAVGRLDINTTGLLLFSTDGELVHRLMHPSSQVEREYAVRVYGELGEAAMAELLAGVMLEDGPAKVERLTVAGGEGANHWYHAVLREGRYREVRRLFAAVGVQVSRLMRIRYGPIALPARVRRGQYFELGPAEVASLYQAAGMKPPGIPAPGR